MGTGLAMMTPRVWMAAAALGALAACGTMDSGVIDAGALKSQLGKLTGRAPAAPPALDITKAAPGEVLLVTIISRNAVAPLTKIAQNGDTTTWISPGRVSITLKDGIVIATRGLNEDLMGADVTGVRAALAAGRGTAKRTHSYLDSEDQIRLHEVTCTITPDGPEQVATTTGARDALKFTETCRGQTFAFTNVYWLDQAGGALVQSRQAIAPTTGFLQINPL